MCVLIKKIAKSSRSVDPSNSPENHSPTFAVPQPSVGAGSSSLTQGPSVVAAASTGSRDVASFDRFFIFLLKIRKLCVMYHYVAIVL